ncbi:MAG TPA: hypothetical protein VGH28_10875 [Polyangiaceae bacterium]|jgi:hypothetical protein
MTTLAKTARARANALLDQIDRKKDEVARAFYDLGDALRELNDKKLFAALGYATFDAMLADRDIMSAAQARKLIEVVHRFDRDMAQRLGAEKAYALARYVTRTKQDDYVADLVTEGFPVGGRRRPIDEVSVRQITHATQLAVLKQKGQHGENERARQAAESAARKVQATLRRKTDEQATTAVVFRHGSWWLRVLVPAEMAESALG